jgi:lipopolysaccharide transport system permease protein
MDKKNMRRQLTLAYELAKLEIKRKYRQQFLGVLWGLFTPLGMAMVIGLVYGVLFHMEMKDFLPYLFLNLTLWGYFVSVADNGNCCFISAEGYIKQISGLSYYIYPLRTAIVSGFHLLLGLISSLLINLVYGVPMGLGLILSLPGLVMWVVFGFGIACISGVINTRFRDYANIQTILLQILFYASPILFPARMLKDRGMEFLYELNPIYHMLRVINEPTLKNLAPDPVSLITALVFTLSIVVFGLLLVKYSSKRMVFWI